MHPDYLNNQPSIQLFLSALLVRYWRFKPIRFEDQIPGKLRFFMMYYCEVLMYSFM